MAGVRHQLDDDGLTGLADELLLAARARRLLVVVDQFEELLTQTPPGHRAHFAQLLRPALGNPVLVVATLRPEFLDQLLADADLAVLPPHSSVLQLLHREALRAVIEGPAQLAGIEVDEELVARLVADTGTGEALPLLAFTLAELAEGVGRGGHLSLARYEQLGGVQGALTRQADAALAEATAAGSRPTSGNNPNPNLIHHPNPHPELTTRPLSDSPSGEPVKACWARMVAGWPGLAGSSDVITRGGNAFMPTNC